METNRLVRQIQSMPERVRAAVKDAIDQNADELVALQKRLAPRKTGRFASSIRKEPGSNELSVRVVGGGKLTTVAANSRISSEEAASGVGAYDYSAALEFGTENMVAKPSFYPGYRSLKKRMKARISRAARKAIVEDQAASSAGSARSEASGD